MNLLLGKNKPLFNSGWNWWQILIDHSCVYAYNSFLDCLVHFV